MDDPSPGAANYTPRTDVPKTFEPVILADFLEEAEQHLFLFFSMFW
jgi:hypothetical protein